MDKGKKTERFFTKKVWLFSFLWQGILSAIGIFILPEFFQINESGVLSKSKVRTGVLLIFFAITVAVFFFSAMVRDISQRYQPMRQSRKIGRTAGQLLLILFFFMLGILLFALLSGVLAVLIYGRGRSTYSLEQIKSIIGMITDIAGVAIAPVFLNILAAFSLESRSVGSAVKDGIKSLGGAYLKILILLAALLGVGYALFFVSGKFQMEMASRIFQWIVMTALGIGMLPAIFWIYDQTKRKRAEKIKSQREGVRPVGPDEIKSKEKK